MFLIVSSQRTVRGLDLEKAMDLSFWKIPAASKVCISKGIICVMINILWSMIPILKHQTLLGYFLKHILVPTVLKRNLKMVRDCNWCSLGFSSQNDDRAKQLYEIWTSLYTSDRHKLQPPAPGRVAVTRNEQCYHLRSPAPGHLLLTGFSPPPLSLSLNCSKWTLCFLLGRWGGRWNMELVLFIFHHHKLCEHAAVPAATKALCIISHRAALL